MPNDPKINELNNCSPTDIDTDNDTDIHTENESCSDEIFKNLKNDLSKDREVEDNPQIAPNFPEKEYSTKDKVRIDDTIQNDTIQNDTTQNDTTQNNKMDETFDEKCSFLNGLKTIDISRNIFHFVNYILFINWFLYFIDFNVDCLFAEKLLFLFFILKSSYYIYNEYVKVYLDKLFNFYFVVDAESNV